MGCEMVWQARVAVRLRQPRPIWKEFKVCVCAYAWVDDKMKTPTGKTRQKPIIEFWCQ